MLCVPGLCIKCGKPTSLGGIASPAYEEVHFSMSDGSNMAVGICHDCVLLPEEFPEVMKAVNDAWDSQGSRRLTSTILNVAFRLTYSDILRRCQGGRCLGCHEPITDKWVITHGFMLHEGCNLPGEGRGELRGVNV